MQDSKTQNYVQGRQEYYTLLYIRDRGIFPDKRCNACLKLYNEKFSKYSLPKCRLQLYKTSLVPTVIVEWNTLPQELRDVPSFKTFSQKIISRVNKINNNHPPEYFSPKFHIIPT